MSAAGGRKVTSESASRSGMSSVSSSSESTLSGKEGAPTSAIAGVPVVQTREVMTSTAPGGTTTTTTTTTITRGAAEVSAGALGANAITTTTLNAAPQQVMGRVISTHGGSTTYMSEGGEYLEFNANSPHRVEETRRVSSVIVSEQYMGERPQTEEVRYVEVPVIQEVITHVPRKEIIEVEKRVPKYEYEWTERIVEVPQIHYIDKQVEVPRVQEVIRKVPKVQVVDVPKEIIRTVPKVEIRQVEKIVQVPGEIIEVPKPYTIQNKCGVHRFLDTDVPVVVAQTTKPMLIESADVVDVDVIDYEPEVIPVDVHVIKPVQTCVHSTGEVVEERHRLVTVPTPQYNTLLKQLNAHIDYKDSGLLPFILEANGTVAFLADQLQSRYVPLRDGAHIEGLEAKLRRRQMTGKQAFKTPMAQDPISVPQASQSAMVPQQARSYVHTPASTSVTMTTSAPTITVAPTTTYASNTEMFATRQYSAPRGVSQTANFGATVTTRPAEQTYVSKPAETYMTRPAESTFVTTTTAMESAVSRPEVFVQPARPAVETFVSRPTEFTSNYKVTGMETRMSEPVEITTTTVTAQQPAMATTTTMASRPSISSMPMGTTIIACGAMPATTSTMMTNNMQSQYADTTVRTTSRPSTMIEQPTATAVSYSTMTMPASAMETSTMTYTQGGAATAGRYMGTSSVSNATTTQVRQSSVSARQTSAVAIPAGQASAVISSGKVIASVQPSQFNATNYQSYTSGGIVYESIPVAATASGMMTAVTTQSRRTSVSGLAVPTPDMAAAMVSSSRPASQHMAGTAMAMTAAMGASGTVVTGDRGMIGASHLTSSRYEETTRDRAPAATSSYSSSELPELKTVTGEEGRDCCGCGGRKKKDTEVYMIKTGSAYGSTRNQLTASTQVASKHHMMEVRKEELSSHAAAVSATAMPTSTPASIVVA